MSGPPVRPRSRELEIVRVLFDKHLLERAVNLAEARWDGSGDMVRLAYHWQDLSPADRREQLEKIGPEQLARFRSLADLDPELAAVLDTLEQRGVISGTPVGVDDVDQSDPEPPAQVDPYEAPEQAPHVPEPRVVAEAGTLASVEPDVERDWRLDFSTIDKGMANRKAALEEDWAEREERARKSQARQAEAVRSGEELLQRVRARLDSTARRVTSNPIGSAATPTLPASVPARLPGGAPASGVTIAGSDETFTPPPDYWLKRFRDERVIVVERGTTAPTDDQLVALSNEFGLTMSEFVVEPGSSRQLFGGLKRHGSKVDVRVGPLPAALAEPSLAVIHGRLMSRIEERMRSGMVDIPGTRATVRMDPEARVIVIL